MAAKTPRPPVPKRGFNPDGFDVVCTIGRVVFGQHGEHSPRVAAFMLIAEHGSDGRYEFPDENADTLIVTVETDGFEGRLRAAAEEIGIDLP